MTSIGLSIPILIIILAMLLGLVAAFTSGKISKSTLALLIILLIAAALRLRWIEQPFVDIFSWRQSSTAMIAENFYRTNANIFYPEVNWTGPGPNYQGREFQTVTYLAMLVYRLIGQQDWIGRLIAVFFGVWGVFALYQLVKLAWGETEALLAAALMAIIPGAIFIERSFLPDPAMVALMTTSLWFLILYLERESLRFLIVAAITAALGALTKLPGLIVGLPALYAIAVLLPKKPDPLRRLLTIAMSGLLVLVPVVLYYFWARHLAQSYPPYHFSGSDNWIWDDGIYDWLSHYFFIEKFAHISAAWIWSVPVLFLTLVGFCVPFLLWWQQRKSDVPALVYELPWLFSWWLIAFGLYYVIGAKQLVTNPWNLHVATPAIAALSALAIQSICQAAKRRGWTAASVAIVIGIFVLILVTGTRRNLGWLYYAHEKEDHLLGLAIQQLSDPEDLVVTITDVLGNPTAIYYSQRRGWIYPPVMDGMDELLNYEDKSIDVMIELRRKGAGWLGIDSDRKDQIWLDLPLLAEYIESSATLVEERNEYAIFRFDQLAD